VITLVNSTETEIRFYFSLSSFFRFDLYSESLILDAVFRQKLHFDLYLNRLMSLQTFIYIAPLQVGLLRSAPNPSAAE